MTIGVFDSGVGGKSVANAIAKALPEHRVIYKNDRANVPYGTKPPAKLLALVEPILQEFIDEDCDIVVIACNTVSTTILDELRSKSRIPLVGVEPLVAAAVAASRSKVITVCATPATLASSRYHALKQQFAEGYQVIEPDCSDWAYLIEHNQMNEARIRQAIEPALAASTDAIVLGCTHYHWIEREIRQIAAGRAVVLQPEPQIIDQLQKFAKSSSVKGQSL